MEDTISVILPVYNQEGIIEAVFSGIAENSSENVQEIIVILDGCTDNSAENIRKVYHKAKANVKEIITPNLNEILANNVGFRASSCDYSIVIQDDCIVTEKNYDKRLLKPFKLFPNVLGVSGRDADDYYIENGKLAKGNTAGVDVNSPREIFAVRDSVNRSPLMLDNKKLKQLNYLDESFAPINADDIDLSIRGYKEFGYIVGSYQVGFHSPPHWGTTRKDIKSYQIFAASSERNLKTIVTRHYDYLTGEKHSKDIVIE